MWFGRQEQPVSIIHQYSRCDLTWHSCLATIWVAQHDKNLNIWILRRLPRQPNRDSALGMWRFFSDSISKWSTKFNMVDWCECSLLEIPSVLLTCCIPCGVTGSWFVGRRLGTPWTGCQSAGRPTGWDEQRRPLCRQSMGRHPVQPSWTFIFFIFLLRQPWKGPIILFWFLISPLSV